MELRRRYFREIRVRDGLPEDNSYPSNHTTTGPPSLSLFLSSLVLSPLSSPPSLWLLLLSVLALNPFQLHYWTAVSPVCLCLLYVGVVLVKEGVAGYRRVRVDRGINKELVLVWNGTSFESQPNSTLRVGSTVLLSDKSKVPADLLLLCSSSEDGSCYISTEEILGECNLQVRRAVRDLQRALRREESPQSFNLQRLNMKVKVTQPCSDFYRFEGRLSLRSQPRAAELDVGNLLARGSVVENTKWVLGLVLYTGMETKIWLNRFPTSRKVSQFQKTLSLWTAAIALYVLCLAGLMLLVQYFTSQEAVEGEDFVLYLTCLGTEVPAAMFVALEIIHVVSVFQFTRNSPHLTFPKGHFPTDLSSSHFLLLDKTGTLTENSLTVQQVVVGNAVYTLNQPKQGEQVGSSTVLAEDSLFSADLPAAELQEKMRLGFDLSYRRLCECLVLCNSVVPVNKGAYFSSPSLDEKAIVEAAQALGCGFVTRMEEECGVEMFDSCLTYHILAIRKFNPDLGRVRVLIQGEFDPGATLYVLGSYSVLKSYLRLAKEERALLEARLEGMMKAGLRTVVLGYRRLEGEVVESVKNRAMNARLSMINVEGKMELILKELEQEISYLGILGLSDSTLPATHSALSSLLSTGLQPWLLSGDSESNTLSCAYSLNLIPLETSIVHIQGIRSVDLACQRLWSLTKDWVFRSAAVKTVMESNRESQQNDGFMDLGSGREEEGDRQFAMSVDGESLTAMMRDKATRRLLLCLLYSAKSVCFHQLLPSHKRELTKLLKKGLYEHPITVAIGDDGGNVPMILEAHVGVGIAKKKDSRAATRSDVSLQHISEFPDLLEKAQLLSWRLTTCVLLELYASTLVHSLKVMYVFVSDATALGLFSIDTSVLYTSLVALFPVLWTVFTPSSLPMHTCLCRRSLLGAVSLGAVHALVLALTISPAFATVSQGSQGSQLELEVVFLMASLATVLQHIMQLYGQRLPTTLIPIICSLGVGLMYYGLREESEGGLEQVFTQAKLVLAVIMGPLACAVVSKLTLSMTLSVSPPVPSRIEPISPDSPFVTKLRSESRRLGDLYQSSMIRDSIIGQESLGFEMHPLLHFRSKLTEREYQSNYLFNLLPLFRRSLVLFCLLLLITIPSAALSHPREEPYLALAVASLIVLLAISWTEWNILALARLYGFIFLILLFALDIASQSVHSLAYFGLILGLLVVKEVWLQVFGLIVLSLALLTINTLIHYISFSTRSSELEELLTAIAPVLILSLLSWLTLEITYASNAHARSEYQLFIETDLRITQNDIILSFLLPDFVRKQVKDGIRYIAEDKGSVTVLFCEICDFDAICSNYGPQELTELLDDIFQQIDELCATFGVAKIETVGKIYLACSGLSDFEAELEPVIQIIPHPQRALELAFGILGAFKRTRLQGGEALQMKIGIHTGPVIAGVVGHHKPQFSLVGDTVNTASRMSSTIDTPNTIQISEVTYQALHPDALPHEFLRRTINAKGKGDLVTYLVTEATQVRIRRTKQSESSTESGTLMRKTRRRSSVVASLRESLELEEALVRNEFALREKVRIWPYFGPTFGNEQRFRNDTLARKLPLVKRGLACYSGALALLALAGCLMTALGRGVEYSVPAALHCVELVLCLLLQFALSTCYTRPYFLWLQVLLHWLSCCTLLLSQLLSFPVAVTTLALLSDLVLLYQTSGIFFRHALVVSGGVLVPWMAVAAVQGEWDYGLMGVLVGLQQCVGMYYEEKNQRTFFSLSAHANREIANTERLLTQMLPIHAYEGLKHQDWVTDRLLDVTLLYADISGFTAWSSKHSPQEVVTRLGQIYTQFDQICNRLAMYKVHTIGDCYVAMSATSNSPKREVAVEAYQMVCLALEMTGTMEGEELRMRVGVHTGEVVAGIMGSKVVRYDIYGKDVLVANKMESNGQAGRINVSEKVKLLLEVNHTGKFTFELNKQVDIAEVGVSVQCYFLSKASE